MEGLFQTKAGARGERKIVANVDEEVAAGPEVNVGVEGGDVGNLINTQKLKATSMLKVKENKLVRMTQINLPQPNFINLLKLINPL